MYKRCCALLCSRAISTTSSRRAIDEFFPPQIPKLQKDIAETDRQSEESDSDLPVFTSNLEELKFGRQWEKSDLQALKSPVLHSLWYVLLKERNRALTADAYFRQHKNETSPYGKRLGAVQQSLENLKEVVEERELSIDIAKTHLWMKRVANLLGKDYAKDLAETYVKYTQPHIQKEQTKMKTLKHHQLFTKEFNRKQQPYEQYKLEYKLPGTERWESKLAMYESDPNFQNELDFEPGLEGFLHNIKRADWEELVRDPEDMVESRARREEDRLKIIKRIAQKRKPDDAQKELDNLSEWRQRIQGDSWELDDK